MVRKTSLWRPLLMVALAVGSVIWVRDFGTVIMVASFTVSDPLYLWLVKTQQRKRLIPYGLLLALILGVSYYVTELIIFPHSANAVYRLRNSCFTGLIWAAGGLATAYWSPANKRASLPV